MQPGDLLDGRFELKVSVGSGGMGAVWQALDRATGNLVALKVLRDPQGDAPRFLQEARVLADCRTAIRTSILRPAEPM